ncbi:MAG: endopeptidase La [Peptococcaceae bacterium]|nr:endopeptidase La [Peptococcaceae bacterium]
MSAVKSQKMPMVPLRQLIPLPHTTITIDVGRACSKDAVDQAQENNQTLVLFTQVQADVELPETGDLYPVGVTAEIVKVENNTAINGYKLTLNVKERMQLIDVENSNDTLFARAFLLEDSFSSEAGKSLLPKVEAKVTAELLRFNRLTKKLSSSQLTMIQNQTDIAQKIDVITHFVIARMEDRYAILANNYVDQRLENLLTFLTRDNELIQLEMSLNQRVKNAIDKSQKEYFLREKMKVIRKELGEDVDKDAELDELGERIEQSLMPENVKERARKELKRMRNSTPMHPEYGNIQNYLDFLVGLPWGIYKEGNTDLVKAQKILEQDHYGLEKIKTRILEFLAVQFLRKDHAGSILCLVGPPGIGKTSLARSIARALDRDFIRAALGGVQDVAEIRGHRRTYVGAIPGRIIQGIADVGSSNPVFLLDEIDKLTRDFKGDPSAALLEALDPEQNNTFSDHYLEVPYDLSKVFFITTANDMNTIPGPLRDRMEIIEMSSYTEHEKLQIAKRYLVKKALEANGLDKSAVSFTEGALKEIISRYTREAGVRELERKIQAVCRKLAKESMMQDEVLPARVTKANVKEYLGKPLVDHLATDSGDEIGVAVGMAWTPVGGEILHIESLAMPGKGNLTLTGQLGDIMRESAQISLSYLRSVANKMGVPEQFLDEHDIHVHVPSGAVPKEGPSAGVTLTTSLLSMMLHEPLRQNVAMTGEMTLRGKVLAVGGIREKVTAAHRAGCRLVIIPKECERDLEDIPQEVRDDLEIHLAERVEDVWRVAFRNEVFQ